MNNEKIQQISKGALMMALIFVCTYTIKIPNPATGGYTHMGDCMAFLAVLVLGKKEGALAAGLGAALSDLLTGAALWVLPTFFIKFLMGWIMGAVVEKNAFGQHSWFVGALFGGIWQSIAYTLVKIPMISLVVAVGSIPRICLQTVIGLIIYALLASVLSKSKVLSLQGQNV